MTSNKIRQSFEEESFSGTYKKSLYQTLYFAYKPYLLRISVVIVVGFIGRGLLLGTTNVVGKWADHIVQGQSDHSKFIWLLLIMTSVGFLLSMIFRIGFSRYSAKAVSKIYDETTLRTSRFPMRFFDTTPVGRIVTRFSADYGSIFRLFGGPLAEFFALIFDLILMTTLLLIASPYYLWVILLMVLLNFTVYQLNKNRIRFDRRELSAGRSPSIAHFSEAANGASTVRSFNREQEFKSRFDRLDYFYLTKKLNLTKTVVAFSMQMNLLTALTFLFTAFLAYHLVGQERLSLGDIGVAFGFIALSGITVQAFFDWLAQFEEAMVGVERMDAYLRSPIEVGASLPLQASFKTNHLQYKTPPQDILWPVCAEVKFDQVKFRYIPESNFVLKGLDFQIKAGEKFGIIGKTGSGKSSIIQALFHLYPVESGKISVNGVSPRLGEDDADQVGLVDLEKFRTGIAYISQDPVIFKGTIRDNLSLSSQTSEQDLIDALSKVGLSHYASEIGLSYQIEEKGRNLSQGERQLICLARCLLQRSPVVVLDEATSSIDPQSEELLVESANHFFKDRTMIVIAHRLSTLEKCDRVLWLEDGSIKRLGPTKEVLKEFQSM